MLYIGLLFVVINLLLACGLAYVLFSRFG